MLQWSSNVLETVRLWADTQSVFFAHVKPNTSAAVQLCVLLTIIAQTV
jgi:hypothetical protein